MKRVGIADLKAHLSGHLRTVRKGETLVIIDRETPVARLVPFGASASGLVTRQPTRELQAFKPLPPLSPPVDSLAALLEERQGHR
jgi:antitoxin (DNA-binding transcriptional repressor) of toxin-antitoxin stability system